MKKLIPTAIALLLFTTSCSQNEPDYRVISPVEISRSEQNVALSYGDFAFDLLDASINFSGADNVLISPISAALGLSMLANGASGSTLDEVLATLRLDENVDLETVNSYNRKISRQLQYSDHDLTLIVANSIWTTDNYDFQPDFKAIISDSYDGDSYKSSTDKLSQDINRWITRKTGGLVKEIKVDAETPAFRLINTLIYKQPWSTPFKTSNNTIGTFHNSDNTTSTVDFLNDRRMCRGLVDDTCKMVCIASGFSMFGFNILLPQEGYDIADVMEHIRQKGWFGINAKSRLCDVDISLPKFRLDNNIDLKRPLISMGLRKVFTDSAELGRMRASGGYIYQTIQANEIGIDEEGVMAVAATVIDGMPTANDTSDTSRFDMILDRPFLFVITEGYTKSILYTGVVNHLSDTAQPE